MGRAGRGRRRARHRRPARLAAGSDRSRPPADHRRRDRAARDPALARVWCRPPIPVTALFDVADDSVEGYFEGGDARVDAEWLFREDGPGQLDEALRSLGAIDDDTFVFMAGEATTLAPLRRYLRRELGLPAEQVSASGYWKRGIVNLDHHAPLDPSDPD